MTIEELINLKPRHIMNAFLDQSEILGWFNLLDAAWMHSGNPRDPHAELTSGLCSNGFFDCLRVLKYPSLSQILADQLVKKIYKLMNDGSLSFLNNKIWPKWVIGSPMAGITFAHDVAISMDAPINMFVEKDLSNPKMMVWKRMNIPEGEYVLQIEELITTAHTLNEVEKAINIGNADPVSFLPLIGALVHRPKKMVDYYGDRRVVALIEKEVWAVPPEECPLCKKGSKRLRPKTNWKELTGKL